MDMREFKGLRALIHRETGIWLKDGKQVMLASRLSKRLRYHGMSDFAAYAAYVEKVQDGGQELAEMINCVTTNKTSFFREMHHFDFLAKTLVPQAEAGLCWVVRGAFAYGVRRVRPAKSPIPLPSLCLRR